MRCLIALVLLGPFVVREVVRQGIPDPRVAGMALLAGAFLGVDFLMWNVSIGDIGAGVATIVVNLQVVVFPLVMRLFAAVPLQRRFLVPLPVLLVGVALAGGLIGPVPIGDNPFRGVLLSLAAAFAYSGYLYYSHRGGVRSPRHLVTPVFLATVSAGAVAGVAGVATSSITLDLSLKSWLCLALVALFGQTVGWLLIGRALPRLAPAMASTILLLQPIGAVLLGAVVLGEVPTLVQLAGCVVVLATVWVIATGGPARKSEEPIVAGRSADQVSA